MMNCSVLYHCSSTQLFECLTFHLWFRRQLPFHPHWTAVCVCDAMARQILVTSEVPHQLGSWRQFKFFFLLQGVFLYHFVFYFGFSWMQFWDSCVNLREKTWGISRIKNYDVRGTSDFVSKFLKSLFFVCKKSKHSHCNFCEAQSCEVNVFFSRFCGKMLAAGWRTGITQKIFLPCQNLHHEKSFLVKYNSVKRYQIIQTFRC